MAWLEGITSGDLGIFLNGQDFAATQEMSEEFRQDVSFSGAFGTDGPVLRSVRRADEGTVTFSAILLKRGVARGLNNEDRLRRMRDFEVQIRRGPKVVTYRGVNWTRISIRSTLTQVTLDCDISIPGFVRDAGGGN